MKRKQLSNKWKWILGLSGLLAFVPVVSISAVACSSNQGSNYSQVIAQAILNKSYTIPTQDNKNVPSPNINVNGTFSSLTVTQALDSQNYNSTLQEAQSLIQYYATQNFFNPQTDNRNDTPGTVNKGKDYNIVNIIPQDIYVTKISASNHNGMINVYIKYQNMPVATTPIIIGGFVS